MIEQKKDLIFESILRIEDLRKRFNVKKIIINPKNKKKYKIIKLCQK